MSGTKKNSSGSVYSEREWLNNHFSIKSRGRFNYVSSLPIREGDQILDLGCANGSWSKLIAERVGVSGRVIAVDHEEELINEANKSIENTHLKKRLSFQLLDISRDFNKIDRCFNTVTAFNVGCLLPDPLSTFTQIRDILEPNNGLLILKDSAIASDFYWPISGSISFEISDFITKRGKIEGYDPNFALNSREILERSGFRVLETQLNSYPFTYPFLPEHRKYISRNAQMIEHLSSGSKPSDDFLLWINETMSENGGFFEDKESIYVTTEFTHICKVN